MTPWRGMIERISHLMVSKRYKKKVHNHKIRKVDEAGATGRGIPQLIHPCQTKFDQ